MYVYIYIYIYIFGLSLTSLFRRYTSITFSILFLKSLLCFFLHSTSVASLYSFNLLKLFI